MLKELAKTVPGSWLIGDEGRQVSGIEYDSRLITPGAAFVAVQGYAQDGNRFIDDAIGRGASAIVTEKQSDRSIPQLIVGDARSALADLAARFYPDEGAPLKKYAVTGTNGKTTSCFLLKNILDTAGFKAGLISSLVNDDGATRATAARTTPESLEIFRLLQAMRRNGCKCAVMETSSHALILHRVKNVTVDVALFTNLTRDHLDFHRDMDDYLEAKARLLDKVAGDDKYAVINLDSPEFRTFLTRAAGRIMTYALEDRTADVHAEKFEFSPLGTQVTMVTPAGTRTVVLPLPGRFNLYNALGATAAALAGGIGLDAIMTGLEHSTVVPGRLERVAVNAPFTVYIDFAHTPDALQRTIETLRELGQGRVTALFGCGGDRDRGKRPLMGQTVTALADYSVLTSDNPRSEDPAAIIDDVKPGLKIGAPVAVIVDRREAIRHLLQRARPGDMLIIAGKGDESYQEIKGVKYPWSDREVVREELHYLGFGD
ncbi:MAG: UDP-N-acetylmuramoyl-L-alanyl-D-glutamate--2,6-diaminopimelate ligase [candidate division Zixibacteria bacterium]|nr:UDP-N-acetylmuramoyl-L-alanyl-D-glutamate--2,6-diaminopimelate ligase [candidate division Zixibacteria bacterium]